MSLINVSELISDPDFCQPNGIKVIRRKTTIANHKNIIAETVLNYTGIITIADDTSTEFLPESNRNSESIHVFTKTALLVVGEENDASDDAEGYMSDVVVFQGNKYEVTRCLDNTQYGFCRATAVLMSQR